LGISYYRRDSEDTAHISKETLDDLYSLVRDYTSRLLALSLNIADSSDVGYSMVRESATFMNGLWRTTDSTMVCVKQVHSSKPEKLVACVRRAHAIIRSRFDGLHRNTTPQIFEALIRKPVSKLGYISQQKETTKAVASKLFTRESDRGHRSLKANWQAGEYHPEPLDSDAQEHRDADLITSGDEESASDAGSDNETDTESELPILLEGRRIDIKLEEDDRLEDAIHEQRLWDLINGGQSSAEDPEQDIDDPELVMEENGSTESERDVDTSGSENDIETGLSDLELDNDLDAKVKSAHIEGDSLAAEETIARKRQRISHSFKRVGSQVPEDNIGGRKRKIGYRTQEFITTSDEEEMD